MPIVDRPNKEALTKAIDIFLDSMRHFFLESLKAAPGATARVALEQSLRDHQREDLVNNLQRGSDLPSSIEISHFETIAKSYWDEVFSASFGGDRKILTKFRKITRARNKVSHPAYMRDLEGGYTRGVLCHIAYVLRRIRALEECRAVTLLWEDIGRSPIDLLREEALAREEAEARAQEASAALSAARNYALKEESARKKAEAEVRASRLSLARLQEQVSAAESARIESERLSQAREVELRAARERAANAESAQLEAERLAQEKIAELMDAQRRLKKAEVKMDLARNSVTRRSAVIAPDSGGRPSNRQPRPTARNSPEYEAWLTREIMAGRIRRSQLRQYAGDQRIDGRLVHYVQAACSDMSTEAWEHYVTQRHEAVCRGKKVNALPHRTLRNSSIMRLAH